MNDDLIYRCIRLLVRIIGNIPIGFAEFLSSLLGLLWFRFDKRHRRVTLNNLTHAFGKEMPPDQIEILAKQVFKNLASMLFEMTWSACLSRDQLLSHVEIKGLEHIRKAHAKGRGVLVISGHMGNFEMLMPGLYGTGLKGYAIYRRLNFEPLERFLTPLRERFNVTLIPMRNAAPKVIDSLASGGVVGTMIDQSVDWYSGVFVNFFGRPACTNKEVIKLAMKAQTTVIPLYTIRSNRKYLIEFLPELPLQYTQDPIGDIEVNTQNITNILESVIREYPDQYFWIHNRWKTKNYCSWPRP